MSICPVELAAGGLWPPRLQLVYCTMFAHAGQYGISDFPDPPALVLVLEDISRDWHTGNYTITHWPLLELCVLHAVHMCSRTLRICGTICNESTCINVHILSQISPSEWNPSQNPGTNLGSIPRILSIPKSQRISWTLVLYFVGKNAISKVPNFARLSCELDHWNGRVTLIYNKKGPLRLFLGVFQSGKGQDLKRTCKVLPKKNLWAAAAPLIP